MRRFTFRVLGVALCSVDVEDFSYYEEDEDAPAAGGGSSHNFTLAAPFVDERYLPWEEEDKLSGFGFGAEL